MKWLILLFSSFVIGAGAEAAVSATAKNPVRAPSSILRSSGSIRGGQAGIGFSLLNINVKVAKSRKLERMILGIGNGALQVQEGAPGYFQIENSPQQKRVVINFPQTLNSAFNEKAFQQQFAKSPFVKSSLMVFEPEGQTVSLILNLKRPVSVRAIPVNGTKNKTARLMVDLFDDSLLAKKK